MSGPCSTSNNFGPHGDGVFCIVISAADVVVLGDDKVTVRLKVR